MGNGGGTGVRLEASGRCAGCGADVALDIERRVVRCDHCGAANLVVGRVTLPVARLRPAIGGCDVAAILRRHAVERELAAVPEVVSLEETWIPYWVGPRSVAGGNVRAAIEVDEPLLAEVPEPSGELEPIDSGAADADPAWAWPTLPPSEGDALRYVPFYRLRLRADGREVEAFVDRGRGAVLMPRPLNPGRMRLGSALGVLLASYSIAGLAIGVLAPGPLQAIGLYAATTAAIAWPVARLARRPGGALRARAEDRP